MNTPRDCSGGPIGLGTRRIAQRGLSQTQGSGFLFSNDLEGQSGVRSERKLYLIIS